MLKMQKYISVYHVKYSMLLISDVIVIVVRPLFIFNIKTNMRHLYDKKLFELTITKPVLNIFCEMN